jgi:hypothetical protein
MVPRTRTGGGGVCAIATDVEKSKAKPVAAIILRVIIVVLPTCL